VVGDEFLQSLSPNRTAGLSDLVANWLGIAVFVSIGIGLMRRQEKKGNDS
jgi:VanZ family protein